MSDISIGRLRGGHCVYWRGEGAGNSVLARFGSLRRGA